VEPFSAMAGFLGSWVLLYQYPEIAFQATFPLLVEASFVWFVVYTLTLLPLTLIIYEVFFRGMVQILWLGNTWKAVAIQGILFSALIYLTAGLTLIDAPQIIAAFVAGFVAKKTGSLWYAFLTSYLSIFLTDVLFLSLR
jgi:membrane protease YdiL (CAAX protease family)